MRHVARIPPAKIEVRDIGVQAQIQAFPYIGLAVVVGISGEDFSSKVLLTVPQALEILQRPIQHGWSMGMILATAEGFGVDYDLVLTIDQSLAVVALDDAMGVLILAESLSVRLLLISFSLVPYFA